MDDAPVLGLRQRGRDQPAVPLPAGGGPDRAELRLRPPHADGLRLGPPALRGGGRQGRRGDRLARGHGAAAPRPPARHRDHLDDDQLDRGDPALPLRARRRGPGGAVPGDRRHDPERPAEGVRRPRHLHLPAARVDADHHRHLRLLPRQRPEVEHDLGLGLPHPRSGQHRRAGDRVHAVERHRVRPGRDRRGARRRRVRTPALVLLERPQRLLRGGREVPRRRAACGTGS